MHYVARQNKLETPKGKDEVNKRDFVYYEPLKRALKTKISSPRMRDFGEGKKKTATRGGGRCGTGHGRCRVCSRSVCSIVHFNRASVCSLVNRPFSLACVYVSSDGGANELF